MLPENPLDTYHLTPVSYDAEGYPCAEAPFTSTTDTKRHAVAAPPEKVIPVILVPGIMGSNLRLKTLPSGFADKRFTDQVKLTPWRLLPVKRTTTGWGDKAWSPDDTLRFMAQRFWSLNAGERRRLLDPRNTDVDDRAEVQAELALKDFVFESSADGPKREELAEQRRLGFLKEMKRRGWSTVMQGSYVPFLSYLELNLNRMFYFGYLSDFWKTTMLPRSQYPSYWSIIKGAAALTEEDVKKAARYWYPVHAVGYNWTQSNADSAQHLLRKISEFTERFRTMGYDCEKVILVTHSMGGLVARAAAHPELGKTADGAAERILGVIHGVMPTHGAAAAYRRCHTGFEGASLGRGFNPASRILGKNGPEVAAIFSNSPGALQLLPNKLYGPGWLKIARPDGTATELPVEDPYKEIYEQKDVWWRLMNPEWVDPEPNLPSGLKKLAWSRFLSNLDLAGSFHGTLGASHHQQTCIHYAADQAKHRAFGSLTWAPENHHHRDFPDPASCTDHSQTSSGTVTLRHKLSARRIMPDGTERQLPGHLSTHHLVLSDQDEAGDGTVPIRSASALNETVMMAAAHAPGYDHQESYADHRTREVTAFAIVRLVSHHMP